MLRNFLPLFKDEVRVKKKRYPYMMSNLSYESSAEEEKSSDLMFGLPQMQKLWHTVHVCKGFLWLLCDKTDFKCFLIHQ